MMNNTKKIRKIFFGFFVLIILLAGFTALNSTKHKGATKVDIHVIPEDSLIKVDGIVSNKVIYLKAGNHKLEATKAGWADAIQTIEIKANEKQQDVYLVPAPNSKDTSDWLDKNPSVQQQRETFGSINFEANSNQVSEKYPLVGKLPYIDRYFRIDYGVGIKSKDQTSSTAIYIRASSPDNRRMALNWIRQQGFDPTDYETIFSNVTSPLGGNE